MKTIIKSDSSANFIYIQSPSISAQIPHAPMLDLFSAPYFSFLKHFTTGGGYAPPGNSWEGMDYTFFVDNNTNTTLDIDEVPLQCEIPYGGIRQMDIPVVTVTGGSLPTISWQPVAYANSYVIRLFEVTDRNWLP